MSRSGGTLFREKSMESHASDSDFRRLDDDDVSYLPSFKSPSKVLSDRDPQRWKNPTPPSQGLPSSNRDNIMDALKNLQNKICNLEMERTRAQDNLRALSSETSLYRGALDKAKERRTPADDHVSRQAQDLQTQLGSAELRCRQLDEQLESMRRMVHDAEAERRNAAEQEERTRRVRAASAERAARGNSEQLVALQREHAQLSATQAQAESKIRALEERLNEERHHRRVLQERAAEMASQAEANRILLRAFSPTRNGIARAGGAASPTVATAKASRHVTKKKGVGGGGRQQAGAARNGDKAEPGEHYRLNLAHIPFVVGQATTASHSLGANVQRVIAMMKYHNPRLCAAAARCRRRQPRSQHPFEAARRPASAAASCGGTSSNGSSRSTAGSMENEEEEYARNSFGDLLEQLQIEFSQLTIEHQELARRIGEARSDLLVGELQSELAGIVKKMEAKGDQIASVVRHLEQTPDLSPRKARKMKKRACSEPVPAAVQSTTTAGEVEVITTVKTKGRRGGAIATSSGGGASTGSRHSSGRRDTLDALRDMKSLQTKLRPSDVAWE